MSEKSDKITTAVDVRHIDPRERAEGEIKKERPLTVVQQADNEALSNYRLSSSVAGLCKDLAMKTAVDIGGRKYVPAATMEAIAVAHGFIVSTRPVSGCRKPRTRSADSSVWPS
jgi:hypothetical protein